MGWSVLSKGNDVYKALEVRMKDKEEMRVLMGSSGKR